MSDGEPQQNGMNGESKLPDPDDPEYQKLMWRPADIEQDMKEMDRRKRVDMIMNSQVFREELERIIESQMSGGPASFSALQQMSDLLMPFGARGRSEGRACIPINDIRGVDGLRFAKGEKHLRCKLASVYRLVDSYGWSEGIYNHITVRVSQDQEHFLLNPFGLQYHEVTASSLLKVDMQGNVIDPGSTNFTFNKPGFMLHSAIHSARPDIKAIIHIHYAPCVAVSATKCGLMPISQESAIIGEVSYYDYHGFIIDSPERKNIAQSLGPVNKVLILKNHGIATCGESLEEALYLLQNAVLACETQIRLMPIGLENIQLMSEEARHSVREAIKTGGESLQGKDDEIGGGDEDKEKADIKEKPRKWRLWDLEFEAQMRALDNAGFRTGYVYRQPLMKTDGPRPKNEVEVPPSASSFQYFDEERWLSPLRKLMDGKKTHEKMKWVNSPNVYQKVEVLETGTSDPKKITKWVEVGQNGDVTDWVQEGSPSHGTLIKIEKANQFVPKGTDPLEFKRRQKEIKENRINSKVTAGPQSSLLEGVAWEEVRKMHDAKMSGTGDQVVLVGAASKGIIQRDYQHNALVYKTAYSKNPFDAVTDQELEEYKSIVERKQRGEYVDEDEIPDEVKHLLVEPIAVPDGSTAPPTHASKSPPRSPTSPVSEDEPSAGARVQRSISARLAAEAAEQERQKMLYFQRRAQSERKPKSRRSRDAPHNGEGKIRSAESGGDVSGASRSSKEGSPVKELEESPKKDKDKKKKKGLKTQSFLKKKKHRKEKGDQEKGATEA